MNGKSAAARPMSAAVWAQLLLLGGIWGGSFFFARIAGGVESLHELSPCWLESRAMEPVWKTPV